MLRSESLEKAFLLRLGGQEREVNCLHQRSKLRLGILLGLFQIPSTLEALSRFHTSLGMNVSESRCRP